MTPFRTFLRITTLSVALLGATAVASVLVAPDAAYAGKGNGKGGGGGNSGGGGKK